MCWNHFFSSMRLLSTLTTNTSNILFLVFISFLIEQFGVYLRPFDIVTDYWQKMIYLPNVRALDEAGNTDPVQWTSQSINQSINQRFKFSETNRNEAISISNWLWLLVFITFCLQLGCCYNYKCKKLQFIHTVNGDGSKTAKIIKRQC